MKTWHWCLCAALSAAGAAGAEQAELQPPAPPPAQGVVSAGSPALGAPGGLASAAATPPSAIQISAYFILGGSWTQQDAQFLAVGRTNGFQLGDARIELTGRPAENLWLYLSIDGAVGPSDTSNLLAATRTVALKDAYGVWAPLPHLRVQAGQFKAPQNLEALLEETELKFASRSIVTQGVQPPIGYAAYGLTLDRQLGVGLGTDHLLIGPIGLTAQVAVTNGNGPNQYVNDTQIPTVSGRFALDLGANVSLGVDAYYNPRAYGTQPNLQREDNYGVGGDLRVEWQNLHLLGLVQYRDTVRVTSGLDSTASGYSGEVAYRLSFIEPAVRVSHYNPDSTVNAPAPDGSSLVSLTYYTFGLNLYAPGPGNARLKIDYTHRAEAAGRSLANDGLDLALQVRF